MSINNNGVIRENDALQLLEEMIEEVTDPKKQCALMIACNLMQENILRKQRKIGDKIPMMMEGFMGITFPCTAEITDICYKLHANTGDDQWSACILSEKELEEVIIK